MSDLVDSPIAHASTRSAPFRGGRERLPFTLIDEAVHVLDTPAEPWSIQLELALAGQLDEDRLRRAVAAALQRHPMARARQLPARPTDRTWWWEIAPEPDVDPVRVVHCPDEASLSAMRAELYGRSIPLVEAPPLRLWLAHRSGGDVLLLNANHAAFDGFGCVRLLQSLARAYTGRPDPVPDVDLDDARDVRRHLAAEDGETRFRRARMLAGKAVDVARGPVRLAAVEGSDRPGYGFHHVSLSPEQTKALDTDDGPTINDILLAALTLAIDAWNHEHGGRAGRIGILVPVNLRPKEWREEVVTNFVLNARVVTDVDDRSSVGELLEALSAQSDLIKKGADATLIEVLGRWQSLPLWAKQPLSPMVSVAGRTVCTALLSNLGPLPDPPDFGEAGGETVSASFSAPTRMPCGLSVGAVTIAGQLHLSFRYRHPVLGSESAARFADRFLAELERVVSEL